MAESMEEQLLENEENRRWIISTEWETYSQELKKLSYIAAPMVAVSVLQYLLQVVSMMMVGHLDQISLSSVAIATSITNVTGFSLLSGLVGGLETLSGQAYGANQWQKVGTYTYSAVISLLIVCIPISISWLFMDKLLILMGQDPVISVEAYKFSLWLTPALFGSAILKPLFRYLQIQSLILPMLVTAFLVLCLHISLSWFFIFQLGLGKSGAAIAFCFSIWTFVALLVFYISRSSSCERTRTYLNKDAFLAVGQFFRYATPSALMVCLKWWSFEVLILLSGLLPNPKLETSVLSICLTISSLHFVIPFGLGVGASTRVSNELGSGNPQKALVAVRVAMFLAVVETVVVSTVTFLCRRVLGKAYSNDEQVVDYVAAIAPFLCLSFITDSLQAVISGIARGSGWQIIGAYVNLGAFYLVGIPVASLLCFLVNLKAKGLWIGLLVGSAIQATSFSLILVFSDWQKQAIKAKKRVSEKRSSEENNKRGLIR
ncbi:protein DETOXIFICATION 2-like [Solanum verrucosum]|uniref:protein DETOXIFICATION 2-like n=1 Tax=Solanum verrucosum TaxID=315347 RepID=UPI0020D02D73|nr:protein DETOXIFICATION 2-like [Solanum verrucosum]